MRCDMCGYCVDMDAIDDEAIQRICTGAHVFFNCLGTTRRVAGSAVSVTSDVCFGYTQSNC